MKIAVYPNSFDSIILGYLNIIKQAVVYFGKLIVCVMVDSEEVNRRLFVPEGWVGLICRVVTKLPNVETDCSSTLIIGHARQKRAYILVESLRAASGYENKPQMAFISRKLNPRLEAIFLPPSVKYIYVSSSMVREMVRYGVELSSFILRGIVGDVQRKMNSRRNG